MVQWRALGFLLCWVSIVTHRVMNYTAILNDSGNILGVVEGAGFRVIKRESGRSTRGLNPLLIVINRAISSWSFPLYRYHEYARN